jgi:hypothetical protein
MKNHSERFCKKFVSLLLLTPLVLLAAGCHKDAVQVYQVADDQMAQPAAPATASSNQPAPSGEPGIPAMANSSAQMPSGMVASDVQNAPSVKWITPAGWTEVPPSEMRVGSFKVTGADGKQADVSIVPLPGMAGGDPANVNRWRGQVGLPALSDDQLASLAEDIQAGGESTELYDIAGQNATTGQASRILAAIQHRDGTTWFFKMTGDADLVEQQKPTFIAFLQTLNFPTQLAQAQLPPGHPDLGDMGNAPAMPPGHPDVGSMTAPSSGPVSTQGQPNWQVPADWQPVSAGGFLVAKFMISGQNGATAAVNVSSAGGDGGGLAPNVNRWRGQLGLQPEDEIATVTFAVPNGQGQLVDFSGNNAKDGQPAELVGIMVTQPGQTWFYKLMGDPAVVAAQKDAFTQFVKGVKY